MSRISAMLALTCAFLQVGSLANAATNGEQNPAQQVNAVIEWNRTLLTIVRAPDPAWLPLSTKTAPDPSYPGAHSAISKAGATVLTSYFGNQFTLDVTSESLEE